MNGIRKKRPVLVAATVTLVGGLWLGSASPVSAAEITDVSTDSAPHNSLSPVRSAPSGEVTEAPPVDEAAPGVADRIAKIEANGGELLGGSTVQYTSSATSGGGSVQPLALPAGCSLTVLIYKQVNQIVSDNMTGCVTNFQSASMSSTIGFLAWGTYNNFVASKSATRTTASRSLALEYAYTCFDKTDTTHFRTVTNGRLFKNGTTYYAAAYDIVIDTKCGTS